MKQINIFLSAAVLLLMLTATGLFARQTPADDSRFVTYIADTRHQEVRLYWKDGSGINFGSIQRLKDWLGQRKRQLLFAMNAGMYKPDHSPQGLYMENGRTLSPADTATVTASTGNFYLLPNGVFYITTGNKPVICKTAALPSAGNIKYATQSGPMLLIDGEIHPAFRAGSANLNIRNGVGILPDGRIVFVLSKQEINFYDFASYFKQLGCKNALYLDGFVSRAYAPEQGWTQTDGDFGVMVGVTEAVK